MTKLIKIDKIKTKGTAKIATFNLIEMIIIIVMTAIIVAVATSVIVYNNYSEIKPKIEESGEYLSELESVYDNILKSYVETVNEKELVNAAIKGMYNYLGDPYTSYLDSETTTDLMDRLNGEYYGMGVEITKVEGGIQVVTMFEDGPAEKAGIMVGDIIVKINDTDVTEKTASEVSTMIKTSSTSNIEVTVLRSGITITKNVNLSTVNIPSVTSDKNGSVGIITISTFSSNTYSQFKSKLEALEKDGITSLVIDVRNNGGGYLNSAVDIAELFIEKGKNIYGLESKNEKEFYTDETKEKRNYKVAVLMNQVSASASEILAAALKESYDATLVGTKSYGKGTVQETTSLETGGMVKYTTAYWLTPNGNNINGTGLYPDVEVDLSGETDNQLEAAINAVK